ncbi:hypothetical protein NMT33_003530, partial [Vibrio cholerae]|nr:hypothetical protein [Vibrio cholerae]
MGRIGKKIKMKKLKLILSEYNKFKSIFPNYERKIIYYLPHIHVDCTVKIPGGKLVKYKGEYDKLRARHEKFERGSILVINNNRKITKYQQQTDNKANKLSELIKFAYFSKNTPHAMSVDGFVSLEAFDMFKLIENHTNSTFEHKIAISNGMTTFLRKSDDVLIARKDLAVMPIKVSEGSFGFDITGNYHFLQKNIQLYQIIHLYNKVWEQQSLFNSFLSKPALARTSIEMLLKHTGGSKKCLGDESFSLMMDVISEYKIDSVVSKIDKLIVPYKDQISSNINNCLFALKKDRDNVSHDGKQNFDLSSTKFYMIWFPLHWALTINR